MIATKTSNKKSYKLYGCFSCGRIIEEIVKTNKEKNQDAPYCHCSPDGGKIPMEKIGSRKEDESQEKVLVKILLKQRKI